MSYHLGIDALINEYKAPNPIFLSCETSKNNNKRKYRCGIMYYFSTSNIAPLSNWSKFGLLKPTNQ